MVAENGFGTAFGIFVDRGEPRLPSSATTARVLRHPVYTDDEQVTLGRWLVVGHLDELLGRFPPVPELVQAPWPGGPGIEANTNTDKRVDQRVRASADC